MQQSPELYQEPLAYSIVRIAHENVSTEINPFMWLAKMVAMGQDPSKQNRYVGSVIVKDGQVIGIGNNYNEYHAKIGCEKRKNDLPALAGYDCCPGCSADTHSEPVAIKNARDNGHDVTGAVLYLYGHIQPCIHCDKAVREAGIKVVYVIENAAEIFNLNTPKKTDNPTNDATIINMPTQKLAS